MRLIDTTKIEIREVNDELAPEYAILSHRWEEDEVTLQEIQAVSPIHESGAGAASPAADAIRSKKGYAKLKRSAALALGHGYRYIWIDTCCIDKTSSAELSEAINSMYKWYEKAAVCYAYLSDVQPGQHDAGPGTFHRLCNESLWFTRGWTLQELVAPADVMFYGGRWEYLGSKEKDEDVRTALRDITGVNIRVLEGSMHVSEVSVAQRMKWASKRSTTRIEDMAYSLLGIFDVNMPLLYGEGGAKAFIRLQEEILRASNDHTIFAWRSPPEEADAMKRFHGLLASHLKYFDAVENYRPLPPVMSQMSTAWTTTNQGLRLSLLLQPQSSTSDQIEDEYVAVLECSKRRDDDTHRSPGILVRRLYGDQFARILSHIVEDVPTPSFEQSLDAGTYQTCFFKQNPTMPVPDFMISFGNLVHHADWDPQTRVVEVHPPKSWDSETGTIWSGFDRRQHLTGMVRFHSKIVGDVDFAFGLEQRSRGGRRPWALNTPAVASIPLAQLFDTLRQLIDQYGLENVPQLSGWHSSMDHVPVRIKVHEQKVHGRLSYLIKAWEPTELSGEMVKLPSWDDILSMERNHEWSRADEPDKVEIPRAQLKHLLEDLTVPESLDFWFASDPLSLPKSIRVRYHTSMSQLLSQLLLLSPILGRTEEETTFLRCCEKGNLKMVNDLLLYKSTLKDSVSPLLFGLEAIHWATARGHIDIMEVLLSKGVDVSTSTSQGWTPMHIAGMFGRFRALLWLLKYKNGEGELDLTNLGLDDRSNQMLETPLHLAMSQASTVNDPAEIDALIELSGEALNMDFLDLQNHFNETPMHRLAAGGLSSLAKSRGLGQVLWYETRNSYSGYPGKYVDHNGRTLLWHATCSGHAEGVYYLLRTRPSLSVDGVDSAAYYTPVAAVNQSDKYGMAPLHVACRLGYTAIARALLQAGAWPNYVTLDPGFAPAHYAALFNRAECLEVLIRHGADIHQATQSPEFSCKPIHLANANGHDEVRKVLVAAGAREDDVDCTHFIVHHARSGEASEEEKGVFEIVQISRPEAGYVLGQSPDAKGIPEIPKVSRTRSKPVASRSTEGGGIRSNEGEEGAREGTALPDQDLRTKLGPARRRPVPWRNLPVVFPNKTSKGPWG